MKYKLKLIKLIAGIVLFLSLATVSLLFIVKNSKLQLQVENKEAIVLGLKKEFNTLKQEKQGLKGTIDSVQERSLFFIKANDGFKNEIENLKKEIGNLKDRNANKENKLKERIEAKIGEIENLGVRYEELDEENIGLSEEIKELEEKLGKEKSAYYYNLGVMFSRIKSYNEAISAYKKSLTFDSDNSDAHYNLGLVYKNVKKDRERARPHFMRYLELNPRTKDKKEVEEWIER